MTKKSILMTIAMLFSVITLSAGQVYTATVVNDLRTISGAVDSMVILRGHTYKTVGGGVFAWDSNSTEADNNGTIIQVTGTATGRWIRQANDKKVSVLWFGAYPNGSVDCTAAFKAAIAAVGEQGQLYIPTGRYKITDTLTIPYNGFSVTGDGKDASNVIFSPTQNSVLFLMKKTGTTLFNNRFANLRISSTDTQYRKTAIEVEDVSSFTIENVYVGLEWIGNDSIGIYIKGREQVTIKGCVIRANLPLKIGNNPNDSIYECDHFSIKDTLLRVIDTGAAQPTKNIYVEDNVVIYNLSFNGFNSWIGGDYGFYWRTTSQPASISYNLKFDNVRSEQGTDPNGYVFYIDYSGYPAPLSGVTLINCYLANQRRGLYMRNLSTLNMISTYVVSPNNSTNAIDLANVNALNWQGCDMRNTNTVSLGGLVPVWNGKWSQWDPMPKNALFEKP
ncbi:MAG: hypothetical protein L3J71_05650 [Victivallaceae bacterium]|nr:hypothetical protein [Victivallaceae bacterium]